MKLREYLFAQMPPCSSHDCVIRKPTGMGTNGSCSCLFQLERAHLHMLNGRLKSIGDLMLEDDHLKPRPKVTAEAILRALHAYRCSNQEESGEGIALDNALTPANQLSTRKGKAEVEHLAVYLASALAGTTA